MTDRVTAADRLDQIEARIAAATKGPWEAEGSQVWRADGVLVAAVREHTTLVDRPDADLIAHAPTDLAALTAALRAVLEMHDPLEAEWACGNPSHTNPEVGCPDCAEVCGACGESAPCPTVVLIREALDVSD